VHSCCAWAYAARHCYMPIEALASRMACVRRWDPCCAVLTLRLCPGQLKQVAWGRRAAAAVWSGRMRGAAAPEAPPHWSTWMLLVRGVHDAATSCSVLSRVKAQSANKDTGVDVVVPVQGQVTSACALVHPNAGSSS
jgi:hypothetical protein